MAMRAVSKTVNPGSNPGSPAWWSLPATNELAHRLPDLSTQRKRREFIRITDDVAEAVRESGIAEGMALVCAMHITAQGAGGVAAVAIPCLGLAGEVLWLHKSLPSF